jgi:hypothetical protein
LAKALGTRRARLLPAPSFPLRGVPATKPTPSPAVRHGLTAETVVVALEDIEDYQAFEAAVITDYDARTAVERELVLRLASLLWRMRRATAIETDLLAIQAEILSDHRHEYESGDDSGQRPQSIVVGVLQRANGPSIRRHPGDGSSHADQSVRAVQTLHCRGWRDAGSNVSSSAICHLDHRGERQTVRHR